MERLTERNKDVVIMKNPKLANERLAEFEDFMEKYNIKSIEDLQLRLEDVEHYAYNCNVEQIDEIIKLKQENQALKDRWQELKDWCRQNCYYVEECCGDVESEYYEEFVYEYINIAQLLEKMQELEKED